jgi:potassium efflux system protein
MSRIGPIVFVAGWIANSLWAMAEPAKMADRGSETAVTAPTVELSPEIIQSRLKQAESTASLGESVRKSLVDNYNAALEHLHAAEEHAAKARKFREETKEAPRELRKLKLAKPSPPPIPEFTAEMELEEMQDVMLQAEEAYDALQNRLLELQNEPNRRAERRIEIPVLQEATRKQLQEVEKRQDPIHDAGADPAVVAEQTLLAARRHALEHELQVYVEELHNYETTLELLMARRDQTAVHVAQAEQHIQNLRAALNARRREEVQQQADRARQAAADAHPAVRRLATQNAELTDRRQELVQRMELSAKELDALRSQLVVLKTLINKVTERVNRVGLTEAVGLLLRRQREVLPHIADHQRAIDERKAEISRLSLQLVDLEDQRTALADIDGRTKRILSESRKTHPGRQPPPESEVREVLKAMRDYLGTLIADTNTYLDTLGQLDTKESELIEETRDFSELSSEYILWIRSAELPGISDLADLRGAVGWIFSPRGWSAVRTTFASDVSRHPVAYTAIPAIILTLAVSQHLFRKRLRLAGRAASDSQSTAILPTAVSLVATVFLSVVWPAAFWLAGWRLSQPTIRSDFVLAAARGLEGVALLLATLNFARHLCRSQGLGEAHFNWPQASLRLVRSSVWWLTAVGLPLACLVFMTESQKDEGIKNSLGRAAFIALQVLLLISAHKVWHAPAGLAWGLSARRDNRWWARLCRLGHIASIAAPVVMAALAIVGYYYTAVQLEQRLLATVWLISGLMILHAVLLRWVLLAYRDLALKRARERRVAGAAAADSVPDSGTDDSAPEPTVGLSDINEQTHQLLGLGAFCAFLVGCSLIWVEILPALELLDRVVLWPKPFTMLAEGFKPDATHYLLTLGQLALASLIALATAAAARNVPGLLEIAVLRHLKLDSGARYAIDALTCYVITAVGVGMALSHLGIGWNSVQWLVAAMTVGLGFGLQEIFANFVSGLLLLFERPIRINDIVTIGDVTGRVTRIRIRATTITDGDRRELIVPNKDIFGGKIMNWTLTDTISRMVLKVEVAFGSDADLVKKVLIKVAAENPLVLKDPAPHALFDEFGDSTLVFKLGVYMANREIYNQLRHELNTAIKAAFRKARIEMAVPLAETDVHEPVEPPVSESHALRGPTRSPARV